MIEQVRSYRFTMKQIFKEHWENYLSRHKDYLRQDVIWTIDRFRAKVINHAREIHRKDGTWHLTLNETYPYQRKILRLVERLNKKFPLKQNGLLKDKSLSLLHKHELR